MNYLKEITGGNPELIKEFIQEALLVTNEVSPCIHKALQNKDYVEISRLCHMLKSSMKIFGADFIVGKLNALESLHTTSDMEIKAIHLTTELMEGIFFWKLELEEHLN